MGKTQLKVEEILTVDGELVSPTMTQDELYDALDEAGWSDDPGTGIAVILPNPDGREVLNPTPMAPPLNYVHETSMDERLHDLLQRERNKRDMLEALEESEEEAGDFDISDEFDISFVQPYPVVEMLHEAPAVPGSPAGPVIEVSPEEAKAQLELDRSGGKDGTS